MKARKVTIGIERGNVDIRFGDMWELAGIPGCTFEVLKVQCSFGEFKTIAAIKRTAKDEKFTQALVRLTEDEFIKGVLVSRGCSVTTCGDVMRLSASNLMLMRAFYKAAAHLDDKGEASAARLLREYFLKIESGQAEEIKEALASDGRGKV